MNAKFQRIKSEIKRDLMTFYEDIQFRIDIDFQEAFNSDEIDEDQRKVLLKINEKMLEQVRICLESNIKQINDYNSFNEEQIENEDIFKKNLKEFLLKKCCFYFYTNKMRQKITYKKIGHLIVTDWYLTENQLFFLRYF